MKVYADFWIRPIEIISFVWEVHHVIGKADARYARGMTPEKCPVCGGDELTPIVRTVKVEGDAHATPCTLAFRCGNGHLFLTQRSEAARTAAG